MILKTLIEERYLPEDETYLGSKITSMLDDGSIQKDIKIPFCDFCGVLLKGEKLALCSSCKRKICTSCIVTYQNKIYCKECTRAVTSITKEQFLVLYGIANEIGLKRIKKFSNLNSEDLREFCANLFERGLLNKKGLSIFTHYVSTDKGLSVLPPCESIYQNEGDIQHFITKIREYSEENK